MAARNATYSRATEETRIEVCLDMPGSGNISVQTGFGLLDHFIHLIAFWAGFDLTFSVNGDMRVDAHHTAEDAGLALGACLNDALGDRAGIFRVGNARVPMDEALADVAVDFSGRPWLEWRGGDILPPVLAGEERDVWREFYKAFCQGARCNLHINFLYGKNGHHLLESVAKGLGLATAQAVSIFGAKVRSTKGSLDL
jgi:imidazoleglycerol-phosphate dehydratase